LTYILFETNVSGSWGKIADANVSGNWTTTTYVPFPNLEYSKTYYWRIKAKNAGGNWTNSTAWKFTTVASSGSGTKEITIVPSQPKSEKSIVFLAEINDASGYVYCYETEDVYPITFKNGMGSLTLKSEYGLAKIVILGYASKEFTIRNQYEGDLSIDSPSNALVNKQVEISVLGHGSLIPATVKLTSPSNKKTTREAASSALRVSFDEVGDWTITAEAFNLSVSKKITINPEPLDIQVDEGLVGDEIKITVNNNNADVMIEKEGTTWTYQTDVDGNVFFTPPWAGRYTVTAEAENQRGTKTFDVKTESSIVIKNENGVDATFITEGNVLLIQMKDTEGNTIDANSIDISIDGVFYKTLTMYSGSTLWRVDKQGKTYSFDFTSEDNALYLPATNQIAGMPQNRDALYLTIGGVITAIIIILLILYKKGYVDISRIRSSLPFLGEKMDDDLL
jgi:hypothetical protein